MWENFKKTPFNDEGTMWMGKGRWILPIPGTRDKEISPAAKFGIVGACAFFVVFFILTLWLGRPDYTYLELPHQQTLYNMMGRSLADVATSVGVNSDELIEVSAGTYKLPEGEIYAGIAFETTLRFEDGMLSGYFYTAGSPATAKKAAKDIANVAEMFSIKNIKLDDGTVIHRSALRRYLAENNLPFSMQSKSGWTSGNLPQDAAVTKYLQMLENDPNWEGRVGEYLTKRACYYEEMETEYDPDTQWVSIQIKYYVDTLTK